MLNDDDKLICDNVECGELLGEDGHGEGGYFVDTPNGGFEFCSWGCVAAYASELSE